MKKLLFIPLLFIISCNSEESITSKIVKTYLKTTNFSDKSLNLLIEEESFIDVNQEQSEPDKKFKKRYNVSIDKIHNRNVYIISSKNKDRDKAVLYLHGGAYMANFLPMHWDFIGRIIDETGVTVIAPDYPLAPESNWSYAFSMLEEIQTFILSDYKDVVFMGDSAGAGLALSWTMELKISSSKILNL